MGSTTTAGSRESLSALRRFFGRHQIPVAVVAIACAFVVAHGGRALRNLPDYQWEDRVFIQHGTREVGSLGDCFTKRPVWPGLYRPLTTNLYYFVGRKVFANRIEVHHLINVVFYLANGFLLFLVCRRVLAYPGALIPPVLFVSRFSHVEVVSNTCEFQSLLSVFFTLLAIDLFIAGRSGRPSREQWSLVAFALALFSKETAVVLPALLIVYWWLFDEVGSWRRYLAPWGVAVIWAVLFALVFRRVSDSAPTGFSYDLSFWKVAGDYAAYLLAFVNLLTHDLANVVITPAVASLAATFPARVGVIALFAVALTVAVFHKRFRGARAGLVRVFALGVLFFGVATAPYVILEARLFMRYAYLGHAGLAISSGALLLAVVRSVKPERD
jgi:hypothetical protein